MLYYTRWSLLPEDRPVFSNLNTNAFSKGQTRPKTGVQPESHNVCPYTSYALVMHTNCEDDVHSLLRNLASRTGTGAELYT